MIARAPARLRRVAAALRRRLGELAPVQLTSLRELHDRRPPDADRFRARGEGSVVVPPARVSRPELVSLGPAVLLHESAVILVAEGAQGVEVGAGTRLSRYAHISCADRVTIGREVSSSDHIALIDRWGPIEGLAPGSHHLPSGPITIGDGAYLGYRSVVGPGVTVGAGAYVGEGSVVLEDVPAHAVVYGNPAQVVRRHTDDTRKGPPHP